jgi:glycosyltransferase involved in cell wall biosynthesis
VVIEFLPSRQITKLLWSRKPRRQCQRSQAGLYYTSYDEFAAVLTRLLADKQLRRQLGTNGRLFVQQHYTADLILHQYQTILHQFSQLIKA